MIATAAGCLLQVDEDPVHYAEHHPEPSTNPPT